MFRFPTPVAWGAGIGLLIAAPTLLCAKEPRVLQGIETFDSATPNDRGLSPITFGRTFLRSGWKRVREYTEKARQIEVP